MTVLMELLDREPEGRPGDMLVVKVNTIEVIFFNEPRGEGAETRGKLPLWPEACITVESMSR
jgi:hypothetical protein